MRPSVTKIPPGQEHRFAPEDVLDGLRAPYVLSDSIFDAANALHYSDPHGIRVYRAWDMRTGQWAVLKTARFLYEDSADVFFNEQSMYSRLRHPNIPHLFRSESSATLGTLVLELSSRSLGDDVRRTFGLVDIVRSAIGIAFALKYAHDKDILHADVKPGNVLLDIAQDHEQPERERIVRAKLADWQLAHHIHQIAPLRMSFSFAAPERFTSILSTKQSDIWSFGATIYAVLSGKLVYPNRENSFQRCRLAHMEKGIVPLGQLDSTLPSALCELVMQCLEVEPEDRPRGMNEVIERLLEIEDWLWRFTGRFRS